jgi:UDP-GlcNAc3NAcA epimerase
MTKKILQIVGARPQFIKAAAISRALKKAETKEGQLKEVFIHTGQHYSEEMSAVFFKEMDLPTPDIHLGIGGLSQGAMTGKMLEALESELKDIRPDWTVVYGDTNSTLAGALAAVKLQLPVAHVESGLRSFNRQMPEEINRIVVDHIASLLFVPHSLAKKQLLNEGISEEFIVNSGDVMADTLFHYRDIARKRSTLLKNLQVHPKSYILATIHRQENTDNRDRLLEIVEGLKIVAAKTTVLLPLHPRTEKMLHQFNMLNCLKNHVHLLPPLGYFDMLSLEENAKAIATDSGGVQKVTCFTLREENEWK